MEEFNAYIKNIAIFTLLIAMADIVMPDKYSKKYLNFVLGIILAVTIISPFMQLVDKNFNTNILMENIESKMLEQKKSDEGENILFKNIFEENIKTSIENDLKKNHFEFEKINIYSMQNEDGVYILQKVEVKTNEKNIEEIEKTINEKYAPKEIVFR